MHQSAGIQQMDTPAAISIRVQNIFKLQGRLAKQRFSTLLLKTGQLSQQRLRRSVGEQRTVFAQRSRSAGW